MAKWTRIQYQPGTPMGKNGQRVTESEEHITLSRNAAKEGMVLLKNEGNLLPFANGTKLALFGKGTFDYVKGGGGSGDVTVSYIVNLYQGLKALGDAACVEEMVRIVKQQHVDMLGLEVTRSGQAGENGVRYCAMLTIQPKGRSIAETIEKAILGINGVTMLEEL